MDAAAQQVCLYTTGQQRCVSYWQLTYFQHIIRAKAGVVFKPLYRSYAACRNVQDSTVICLIVSPELLLFACMQAKDQAELNELVIWAASRGLLADVSALS